MAYNKMKTKLETSSAVPVAITCRTCVLMGPQKIFEIDFTTANETTRHVCTISLLGSKNSSVAYSSDYKCTGSTLAVFVSSGTQCFYTITDVLGGASPLFDESVQIGGASPLFSVSHRHCGRNHEDASRLLLVASV